MAATDPFDKILSDNQSSGIDKFIQESILWWRYKVRDLYGSEGAPTPPYTLDSEWIKAYRDRYGKTPISNMAGKMYIFRYNPKTKKTLDYWDTLPLIMALEPKPNGFLGINLHYLPKKRRGVLLNQMSNTLIHATPDDAEEDFAGEKLRNVRSAFKSYKAVKSKSSMFKWAYPCIRRYNFTGLQSDMIEIPVTDWELAAYLPSDYFFKGKSIKYIHRDSINRKTKKFG